MQNLSSHDHDLSRLFELLAKRMPAWAAVPATAAKTGTRSGTGTM